VVERLLPGRVSKWTAPAGMRLPGC